MKEKLIFDSISYTKAEPLTADEIGRMKNKIIKQAKIYVPGYLILTGIAIWFLLRGPESLNDFHRMQAQTDLDDKTRATFWAVAPYFSLFLFILTTIFLTIYYFRSVHPFVKDIKQKKKIAIFYKPKKTAMALFNRYYITIPLYETQQIEISKQDFDEIKEETLLCLEMGNYSQFLLNLKNEEKNIQIGDITL